MKQTPETYLTLRHSVAQIMYIYDLFGSLLAKM